MSSSLLNRLLPKPVLHELAARSGTEKLKLPRLTGDRPRPIPRARLQSLAPHEGNTVTIAGDAIGEWRSTSNGQRELWRNCSVYAFRFDRRRDYLFLGCKPEQIAIDHLWLHPDTYAPIAGLLKHGFGERSIAVGQVRKYPRPDGRSDYNIDPVPLTDALDALIICFAIPVFYRWSKLAARDVSYKSRCYLDRHEYLLDFDRLFGHYPANTDTLNVARSIAAIGANNLLKLIDREKKLSARSRKGFGYRVQQYGDRESKNKC